MNILSFDVYSIFRRKTRSEKYSKIEVKYWIYAWVTPLIIIFISLCNEFLFLANDLQPLYGLRVCWISQRLALLTFFGVPLLCILILNATFFALTIKHLIEIKNSTRMVRNHQENKIRFSLYFKLALLMGFTWACGFIASFNNISLLWYPFVILNGLQGVFIFVCFTLKRKNYQMLKGVIKVESKALSSEEGTNMTSL
ncbi:uncharacterized protein B4U79_05832 [Dinothrombium tinctorium]|uniref:G-protein coupled receptors family 2 profile 2 domain-containing protein n=1 Tax=Dinothrombium tinctorium TaxID=1965070 RepID=A0A3S3NCX1_9ACAR|nr:uncharacterized protein B4U79_05832 [Dinothrombium tinctorium]